MTDRTTMRHLEVQFNTLNDYFKDKKVKFTYEKAYGGYKLTNKEQSNEFNTTRLTKSELWEMLYTINNVLREYTRKEEEEELLK
jgi:hypothetical protein